MSFTLINPVLASTPVSTTFSSVGDIFQSGVKDELIKVMVDGAARFSSPLSALFLFYVHGAITRVP